MSPERGLQQLAALADELDEAGWSAHAAVLRALRADAARDLRYELEPTDLPPSSTLAGWTPTEELLGEELPDRLLAEAVAASLAEELERISHGLWRPDRESLRRIRWLAGYLALAARPPAGLDPAADRPALDDILFDPAIYASRIAALGFPFEALGLRVLGEAWRLSGGRAETTELAGLGDDLLLELAEPGSLLQRTSMPYADVPALMRKIRASWTVSDLSLEKMKEALEEVRSDESDNAFEGSEETYELAEEEVEYEAFGLDVPGDEDRDLEDTGYAPPPGGAGPPAEDTLPAQPDETSPEISEPRFVFRLEGEGARGASVELGADFELRFAFDRPERDDLAVVEGKKLEEARDESLGFDVTVFAPGFSFRDRVFSRRARFEAGTLVEDLVFRMRAPAEAEPPGEPRRIWVQTSRDGRPFYEVPLDLHLVRGLDEADLDRRPVHIDLDGLLVGARTKRPPRKATLMLSANGPSLWVSLVADGISGEQGPLTRLDRDELADRLGKLDSVVQPGVDSNVWSRLPEGGFDGELHDEADAKDCLDRLATAGNRLYDALSRDPLMARCLEVIDELPDGSQINLRTDEIFLPWQILYPADFDHSWIPEVRETKGEVDPRRFWGYRFQIESRRMGIRRDDGRPISGGDGPTLLRVDVNPTIDDDEVNRDARPAASHRALRDEISEGVGLEICLDGQHVRRRLSLEDESSTLIYLFCHGRKENPHDPWSAEALELDHGVVVTPDSLKTGYRFHKRPVLVLNSCSSGAFSPLSFDSFLSVMEEREACGLVGTSFPVPTHFAAAFGRRLLKAYSEGEETIGEIVFRLRRSLLARGHPLGLLYTVQCPLEARAPGASEAATTPTSANEGEVA